MDRGDRDESGLIRYWIEFDYGPAPRGVSTWNPGPARVGVTAFNDDDALRIIQAEFFAERSMPPVKSSVANVDLSTIDLQDYPYNSPPIWRGIWYPATWRSGPSVDDSQP